MNRVKLTNRPSHGQPTAEGETRAQNFQRLGCHITETNRIQFVLLDTQNRTLESYTVTAQRMKILVMPGE
jgi:hypothetical protein